MEQSAPVIPVAEDEPSLQELLRHILQARGYVLEWLGDGLATVERIGGGGVDLVLHDTMLLGPDGLKICWQARNQEQTEEPHLTIIMLTARVLLADHRRASRPAPTTAW